MAKKKSSRKKAARWVNPKPKLIQFALSFPEAWEDHPWGETVVKVRKKVFVFFGTEKGLGDFGLCVKLPQSGAEVLEESWAEPAGYGLGKSGWVMARFFKGDAVPVDDIHEWIEESYCAVAPKTLVRQLYPDD